MDFIVFPIISQKWQYFMFDFCVVTGFENIISMIELDQNLLVYTDAKQWT